jgi:DNA-binding IclR family transcriptional regulator
MGDANLSGAAARQPRAEGERSDPMFVNSVEKAFRVLGAFNAERPTLNLTQLADTLGMDKSTVQRFAYTLEKLGYLYKDPHTKHFELTPRNLQTAYHFSQSNALIRRALPYLLHLSQTTEEATNLSIREGTDIIYVVRFMSRHVLAANVTVGRRLPLYCTAPGRAILSRMPADTARALLEQSTLRAYTPHTTVRVPDLIRKVGEVSARGYAICIEEMLLDDISIAAPIVDRGGQPIGAVNIAVSKARCTPDMAEYRFGPLVISTAQAISA